MPAGRRYAVCKTVFDPDLEQGGNTNAVVPMTHRIQTLLRVYRSAASATSKPLADTCAASPTTNDHQQGRSVQPYRARRWDTGRDRLRRVCFIQTLETLPSLAEDFGLPSCRGEPRSRLQPTPRFRMITLQLRAPSRPEVQIGGFGRSSRGVRGLAGQRESARHADVILDVAPQIGAFPKRWQGALRPVLEQVQPAEELQPIGAQLCVLRIAKLGQRA